ncbi:MAG: rhodanese-like domain-containing protein [Coriobacteriales bacterium]
MGIFSKLMGKDINKGVEEFNALTEGWLLDVRAKHEFVTGHIPGAKNVPLPVIERANTLIKDKSQPVYVYCQSGSRSRQAANALKVLGFTNVHDIGGIASYTGKLVK